MTDSSPADKMENEALAEELAPDLEVLRLLGRGSVASVYLGREPELKRLVAIKVLLPSLARDERARLRFEREAQAAASLAHPNVVSVYRVGRLSDDVPYIVMQYVKGRTMAERLRATSRLELSEARRVLEEIASAVAAAHANGIVHRDIRPDNIILDEETGRPMLSDFGIAAIVDRGDAEQAKRITRTGELVGNPAYMSPEQLRGEPVTERSDIYALGLTAFELIAGRKPFDARSNRELYVAHIKEEPPALSDFRPDVGDRIEDLVERCLAKEPGHRPSADDVVERLRVPRDAYTTEPLLSTGGGMLSRVAARRLPQLLIVYAGAGFGALELVDQLVGHDYLPEITYQIALVSYVFGIPAVAVGGWFHGKKGAQRFRQAEYWLYGVLGVFWAVTVGYLLLR